MSMSYYGNSNFWLPKSTDSIQIISTIELPKPQLSVENPEEYLNFLGVRVKGMIEKEKDKDCLIGLIKNVLPDKMLEEIPLESIINFQSNGKSPVSLSTAIAEGLTLTNLALIELLNEYVEFVFPLQAGDDELAEKIIGQTAFKDWLVNLTLAEI